MRCCRNLEGPCPLLLGERFRHSGGRTRLFFLKVWGAPFFPLERKHEEIVRSSLVSFAKREKRLACEVTTNSVTTDICFD